MIKLLRWSVLVACLAFANASAAAVLVVDVGILMGADGVDVGGTLYDVRFVDGSCISVFSGCDSLSDFAFDNAADAETASQALLDQVLIDSIAGLFDSRPRFTNGCHPLLETRCDILTPYGLPPVSSLFELSNLVNDSFEPLDAHFTGVGPKSVGDEDTLSIIYARWSLTPTVVPVPATLSCLGIGLLAFVLTRRRRITKT